MIKILRNPTFITLAVLAVLDLINLRFLFAGQPFLAGGDNYTYLHLKREEFYPYVWDLAYPFGVRSFTIANLLGFPLYNWIGRLISGPGLERALLFFLYFFQFVAFVKLASLFSARATWLSLIPPAFFLAYNVYASLNPFTLHALLYGIYLPLSLYFFIKLLESDCFDWGNICRLIVAAVIFSPIYANAALALTVFVPQTLFLLMNLRKLNLIKIKNLLLYSVLLALVNLWWLLPLLAYFESLSADFFSKGSFFVATAVGNLFQNFRLIGQWGWYSGHFLYPYYPYNLYYDQPLIVILTYGLILLSFYEALRSESGRLTSKRIFLLGLALVGLFLMSGARLPFGALYQILFDNLPGFKTYREPFTKFSSLYSLSIALLFCLFLARVESRVTGFKKFFLFSLIFTGVFFSVKPAFLGEDITARWNGSVRSYRVNIPDYWREFSDYAQANLAQKRLLTTPEVSYGSAWNWLGGFTSADDVAPIFLPQSSNVLRVPFNSGSEVEALMDGFFSNVGNPEVAKKYLSLMGVDYVLQENDLDWRYDSRAIDPEKAATDLPRYLTELKTFGLFTKDYLARIPNDEPDPSRRSELSDRLLGRPALILYQVPQEVRTTRIYVPDKVFVKDGNGSAKLGPILASASFTPGSVYARSLVGLPQKALPEESVSASGSAAVNLKEFRQRRPAEVGFSMINPTRYEVSVRGAREPFLLQFSERFDPGWQIYPIGRSLEKQGFWSGLKERLGLAERRPLAEGFHLKTNFFSNGWLISESALRNLNEGDAQQSGPDNLHFTIEFSPQRAFSLYFALMVLTSGFCLISLILASVRSWLGKR